LSTPVFIPAQFDRFDASGMRGPRSPRRRVAGEFGDLASAPQIPAMAAGSCLHRMRIGLACVVWMG